MRQMLLWQVTDETPQKLTRGGIDLETHLEDWIERDPSLLQNGLTIVGRQVAVEGGTLDLLALDPQGRWVVIEIKRGRVLRKTIAQALDYAACITRLPDDELRGSGTCPRPRVRFRDPSPRFGSSQMHIASLNSTRKERIQS